MALILNEEQQLLRESAKSFIEGSSPVSAARARRDAGEEWSPQLWADMAQMGWTGITIPEDFGGLAFGYVGAGLVMEECGRTLAASPLVSSAYVGASLIAALGSDAQKAALLPSIVAGEAIITLAVGEGERFDPATIATTAVADGDGYVLSGGKSHVIDGLIADSFIVAVNIAGAAGVGLFLVDAGADNLTVDGTLNVDARNVASLRFESVRVAGDALLGVAGGASDALERALDIGAVLSAAELLGVALEAFERTLDYIKDRKQFGVAVGSFQSLQHRAAQLFCELELCRSAVLKALQAIDEDDAQRSRLASMAKAKMARTAALAVNEAVQMHGGIGMTDEFDIGFFMKRAVVLSDAYGGYYFHAERFAGLGGY